MKDQLIKHSVSLQWQGGELRRRGEGKRGEKASLVKKKKKTKSKKSFFLGEKKGKKRKKWQEEKKEKKKKERKKKSQPPRSGPVRVFWIRPRQMDEWERRLGRAEPEPRCATVSTALRVPEPLFAILRDSSLRGPGRRLGGANAPTPALRFTRDHGRRRR